MGLADRLRERSEEIEQATLTRVHAVSDPSEVDDPEYALGLREAVSAGVAYAIAAIDAIGREPAPVPDQLLGQARAAARNGVPLDTVLRRYSAGYTLLGDFLIREAEDGALPISRADLKRALRSVSTIFDRLVASVSEAYTREADRRPTTSEQRRVERVRRLLDGEPIDTGGLDYEFDNWHLGAIVAGGGARAAIRSLAAAHNRQVLQVQGSPETIWAWLGGKGKLTAADALSHFSSNQPDEISLALGEAGKGLQGWRLTHRQARAAFPIALRGMPSVCHYTEVALLASTLGDELLSDSLRKAYLIPLEDERDGGASLRTTLLAYFAAGRNVSSAAAALGVSRQTIKNRLARAEEKIGGPLGAHAAEIETALQMHDLELSSVPNWKAR